MMIRLLPLLSLVLVATASCGAAASGDSAASATATDTADAFAVAERGSFDGPWAMALLPGGQQAVVSVFLGKVWLVTLADGRKTEVTGAPAVDFGGQGGLGDVQLAPDFARSGTVYLTWAERGGGDTRGAALGRGKLVLGDQPRIDGLDTIWRQSPKTTGRGHYAHRIAFSPDGRHLFLASGDRQKMAPAQDLTGNLGKVLRLNLDGTPAVGNPFAARGGVSTEIWSYGHRNMLGLQFDSQGRLWGLEHGPAGGDELNLISPGANYGWPIVSDGDHYGGKAIPRHATRPDLAAPAISWNPVIAPGDFLFYAGRMWPEWKGQAIIAGLGSGGLVRVRIDGDRASEQARYPLGNRIRDVAQGPDGALWVIEDGSGGRLLRLSRK